MKGMSKELNLVILISCFSTIIATICESGDDPVVNISTGQVLGQKLVSATNRLYFSFRGIPYATPPIGPLRFKAPQPPNTWNGTLKAFDIPPACSQPWVELNYPEKFSEDCLYLNVFTPQLKSPRGTLMPVMVWIHGGKHYKGSSTSLKYGADFLISEDVVVVTFNFRLGVFGYLNMNTRSAQGNASDKDKVAALKWVQKEIQHFGGDPSLVTIFGGSSGAADVNALYFSPMARGLFHRAIAQSCVNCGFMEIDAKNPGVKLAEMVGCPSDDMEGAVACLRSLSADYLAEGQMAVIEPKMGMPQNHFAPTIEEFHGEEIYLPDYMNNLMASSQSRVPYLMGVNSAEGIADLSLDNENLLNDVNKNFKSYLPNYIFYKNTTKGILEKIELKLRDNYFGNKSVSTETLDSFVKFMTDVKYAMSVSKNAKTISTHAPVYLYYFTFEGKFRTPHPDTDPLNLTGSTHADELGYLFYRDTFIPEHNHLSDYQRECVTLTRMIRLWTNFAKYGNPTPDLEDRLLNEIWLPVNKSSTRHFVINDSLRMENQDLLAQRLAVWEDIHKLLMQEESTSRNDNHKSKLFDILETLSVLSLIAFIYIVYVRSCDKGYSSI